jgi:membrane protein
VSLLISTVLTAFGDTLARLIPSFDARLMRGVETSVSFATIALLFAAIFRYVPDALVRWTHAVAGGAFTALLFTLGKWGIGAYIGSSDPGSAYGAAGSLAIALLWIYYTAMIVLLGAEFTEALARRRGQPIRPEPGAARVIRRQERVETGTPRAQ